MESKQNEQTKQTHEYRGHTDGCQMGEDGWEGIKIYKLAVTK